MRRVSIRACFWSSANPIFTNSTFADAAVLGLGPGVTFHAIPIESGWIAMKPSRSALAFISAVEVLKPAVVVRGVEIDHHRQRHPPGGLRRDVDPVVARNRGPRGVLLGDRPVPLGVVPGRRQFAGRAGRDQKCGGEKHESAIPMRSHGQSFRSSDAGLSATGEKGLREKFGRALFREEPENLAGDVGLRRDVVADVGHDDLAEALAAGVEVVGDVGFLERELP
jgi:hypothetical protein